MTLTLHHGLDYAVIMRPDDTTDTALVQVKYPTDEDMALLQQMAAGPELLEALQLIARIARWSGPCEQRCSIELSIPTLNVIRAAIAKATGAA